MIFRRSRPRPILPMSDVDAHFWRERLPHVARREERRLARERQRQTS